MLGASRQRLFQIFPAESGDLHLVKRRSIQPLVLAVQCEIQKVIVWENPKITIDPKPAVGSGQTRDFLPSAMNPTVQLDVIPYSTIAMLVKNCCRFARTEESDSSL